jgi:nitrile hydratase accessory protein
MTDGPPAGDLSAMPAIPRDVDGSVFSAPWQAQAFAMTVRLHEQGAFGWDEWAAALAARIAAAAHTCSEAAGDSDHGDGYWHHWLAALETLVAAKGLASADELATRKDAWAAAAAATPHGEPIELDRAVCERQAASASAARATCSS